MPPVQHIDVLVWGLRLFDKAPQPVHKLKVGGVVDSKNFPASYAVRLFPDSPTARELNEDSHSVLEPVSGGDTKVLFCIYYPQVFDAIRELYGISFKDFREALTNDALDGGEKASVSKSGSKFWHSSCRRYLIKSTCKEEINTVRSFSKDYLDHLKQYPESLLSRIFGVFSVDVGKTTRHFIVMNNIFQPEDEVLTTYDLKGTTEDRKVAQAKFESTKVGKDLNFTEQINLKNWRNAERLRVTVEADCKFLKRHRILDYSLLLGVTVNRDLTRQRSVSYATISSVGVDERRRLIEWYSSDPDIVYRMGIIDILQQWTPKKVAAHCFKRISLRLCYEIDTEPPGYYAKRFVRYVQNKTSPSSEEEETAIHTEKEMPDKTPAIREEELDDPAATPANS